MITRYKIRFPNKESYKAAHEMLAVETTHLDHTRKRSASRALAASSSRALAAASPRVVVHNHKRKFISLGASQLTRSVDAGRQLDEHLETLARELGAEVVPDFQYHSGFEDMGTPPPQQLRPSPQGGALSRGMPAATTPAATAQSPSLDDVVALIRAKDAWPKSRGQGVAIAVVDTGVAGSRPEFPASKRVGQWQPVGDDAWTDSHGHGTMCACIALATKAKGGVYNGVAPDASLISCKTSFFDTELTAIYDYLTDLATKKGMNIITTNSYGWSSNQPPPDDSNSDFIPALNDAIAAGIKVVFAAGNDHQKVGGKPNSCSPNSIWLSYKSRADVLVVANCTMDLKMWFNSSRGPGQYFGKPNTNRKPDVTAPTPSNGYVVFGDEVISEMMWGTSGAGPQVAGLAALLLARKPDLSRDQLFKAIRESAGPLASKLALTCAGSGLINCKKAVDSI